MARPNPYFSHPDFKWLAKVPAVDIHKRFLVGIYCLWGRLSFRLIRVPKTISVKHYEIVSNGSTIPLQLYKPKHVKGDLPCLIFYHGGGFVLPAFDYHKKLICQYVLQAQCAVLLVDYRLAPHHVFPCGFNDCYQSLLWLRKQASQMHINANKIAVMGDSAGGCLAAGVAQKAYDELGKGAVCAQLLLFPVLDDRQETDSMQRYHDAPVWNSHSNQAMWQCYLTSTDSENRRYAVPAKRVDLSKLPKAYIESTEFDCLKDEAEEYAEQLQLAGVETLLLETEGTIHGYDSVLKSGKAQEYIQHRIRFLKAVFSEVE